MRIAFATLCYGMGKVFGAGKGSQMVHAMIAHQRVGNLPVPESVQTVHGLEALGVGEIGCYVDTGASHLGKARCRALHWGIESGAPVWIACDDDVTATNGTLRALLAALDTDTPRAVAVPCALRQAAVDSPILDGSGRQQVNIDLASINVHPTGEPCVGDLMPIHRAGFGLVGVNRAALDIIKNSDVERFIDVDGVKRTTMFRDVFEGGRWWGEDLSFWMRLHDLSASIERWALVEGESVHAGIPLRLDRVRELHQVKA
jgi:hypothetical protein